MDVGLPPHPETSTARKVSGSPLVLLQLVDVRGLPLHHALLVKGEAVPRTSAIRHRHLHRLARRERVLELAAHLDICGDGDDLLLGHELAVRVAEVAGCQGDLGGVGGGGWDENGTLRVWRTRCGVEKAGRMSMVLRRKLPGIGQVLFGYGGHAMEGATRYSGTSHGTRILARRSWHQDSSIDRTSPPICPASGTETTCAFTRTAVPLLATTLAFT